MKFNPENSDLDVFVVAKWQDGSYIRFPATWKPGGQIEIVQAAWHGLDYDRLLARHRAHLLEITGHLRNEPAEFLVDLAISPVGEVSFKAGRERLAAWTEDDTHRLREVPIAKSRIELDLSVNEVESTLIGTIGLIERYLKNPPNSKPCYENLAKEVNRFVSLVCSGAKPSMQLKLRDGSRVTLPTKLNESLRGTLKYVSLRTMPCNTQSSLNEYSSLLALEDCYRYLRRQIRMHSKEAHLCKEALIQMSPNMLNFYPDIGEVQSPPLQHDQRETWPGAEAIKRGLGIIGKPIEVLGSADTVLDRINSAAPFAEELKTPRHAARH